jgi:hypothetical protein
MRRGKFFFIVYYSKDVYHACNKGIIQSLCGVILVPQLTSPKLRVLKVSQGLNWMATNGEKGGVMFNNTLGLRLYPTSMAV